MDKGQGYKTVWWKTVGIIIFGKIFIILFWTAVVFVGLMALAEHIVML